jgi:hypothetical protein
MSSSFPDGAYFSLKQRAYAAAIFVTIGFSFLHLISLPIGITYDGFTYIDLADVLGSARFPADWYPTRTPLYPLALKLSFWLLGTQPLAAMLVLTILGAATVLLLGRVARLVAGEWCGVIVLLLLTFYPTFVAYEHLALTEVGTSFFLALMVTVALWKIQTEADVWKQAAAFCLVFAAGYYWRQLLLQLAIVGVVLWATRAWTIFRRRKTNFPLILARFIAGVVLIVVIPTAVSHLWDPYIGRAGLTVTTLRQGIVRQALLAPDDPIVGANKEMYVTAVRESRFNGNFFSGTRNDLFAPLMDQLFRSQPPGQTKHIFLHGIRSHPKRYVAGVLRTLALFSGAKAKVNENRIFREHIISPTWTGSKIGEGPPRIEAKIKGEFRQLTTTSAVARLLWALCAVYDPLLILVNVVTAIGFIVALCLRNFPAVAISIFPLAYIGLYAVILASIDRFALPIYPLTFADAVMLPPLLWRSWSNVRSSADAPAKSDIPLRATL